jgi:HAE1 family hydrophobic/amphiphilic exporter-1
MNLPELSIHRHVLAYMLSGVLILFGLISYQRIGVERMPSVDVPVLTVTTVLPGANPGVVDASLTNIIESAVNSVSGIESLQSNSLPGVSLVVMQFEMERDIDAAFNEVQAKLNEILRKLPDDADPPVLAKLSTAGMPVMWLALQGDRTLQQLNQYARNVLKKRLETVSGVGSVVIAGERQRTIRVELDLQRLNALNVSVQEVTAAFGREHLKLPGGYVGGGAREDLLKLDVEFHSVADLEKLIVAYRGHLPIYLRDLAEIKDDLADNRRYASFDGQPAVALGLLKISNANTVALAAEVQRRLDAEIIPQLPPGLSLHVASNDAEIILDIIHALQEHLLLGTLLAALVVWLFLKSLRATLIVATAIPVSLLGAIAAIYFAGYSFNIMTLLGLLLLIGVVVDDAIVVLENIYRHREEDPDASPAALAVSGANQVVFAVIAASLTLVSLFASVVFMGGIVGRFLQSFAMVVVLGVLVSLFVSVTLTPMLCARHLHVARRHGWLYRTLEAGFRGLEWLYAGILRLALRFRWSVVLLTIAIVYGSGWFFGQLGKGFIPDEDEARFLVTFKTPLGSTLDYTVERMKKLEEVLNAYPEVQSILATVGTGDLGVVTEGSLFVRLVPRAERSRHQSEVIRAVQHDLTQVPGVRGLAAQVPIMSGDRGERLQFVVKGPNLYEVARLAGELEARLRKIPEIGGMDMGLRLELPELNLQLDRAKAQDLGLDTVAVADALRVLAGGADIAKYNDEPGDGERYDIRLKAKDGGLTQASDLEKIYLRNRAGQLVRLDTVASVQPGLGAALISRYNLQYAAQFFANPTIPEGDAAQIVLREATGLLPAGYQVELVGRAKEFGKTVGYMMLAFVTGLILVYMVLASQFNSFIQPLIVMVAQPLAVIGGVAGLWLAGHSLNIYSMIGLVLLVGLVAKNSILLIDLTNQLRGQGRSIKDALLTACPIRMRPVLMTSLTVILALLPAALGLGAGADTNGPLAVAVIGGMVSSTLLTLVVVPAVYSLVENGLERFSPYHYQDDAGIPQEVHEATRGDRTVSEQ